PTMSSIALAMGSGISTSICYVLLWLLEPYGSAFTRIYKVDFDDCCYAIEMNVREHIRLCLE
ncbi:hypothetical protein, partial [Escherichia coli]|uniref:hypothetical protein n=1 Tax=Escherichia coli TaxID=562 RepID=UPI001953C0C8